MEFLHQSFNLDSDNIVEVSLDQQANVMLLDDINFSRYKSGQQFSYFGGLATKSPIRISPPHTGHWNLVIDLGGRGGSIRHSIRII